MPTPKQTWRKTIIEQVLRLIKRSQEISVERMGEPNREIERKALRLEAELDQVNAEIRDE